MVDRKVNIILSAKNRASRVLDRLRKKFRSLGRAATSLKGVIAGSLGTAAVIRGVQASIAAIDKQATAERRLEGVLRATGEAAGFNAEQLKRRAAELQEATTFGDEDIISLQSQLATFGNISDENFSRATEAALNMAAVFDQSIDQSARQLGQSLAEPELALTRLRRQGVVFTAEQERLVESLVESGRTAEAQAVVLDRLDQAFGGVARSIAEGPTGAIRQAQNTIGDFVEEIGAALAPTIARVAGAVSEVGENFIPSLVNSIKGAAGFAFQALGFVGRAIENLQVFAAKAMSAVSFAFTNFGDLANLAIDNALLAVVTFRSQLSHTFTEVIPETLDWFLDNWKDIFTTIWDFTRKVISNLAENVVEVLSNLPALISGKMDLSDVWTPITEGFKSSISELPEFADREVGALEKQLRARVAESGGKLAADFREQLDFSEDDVRGRSGIPQFLQQLADDALDSGGKSAKAAADRARASASGDATGGAAGGGGGQSTGDATGGAAGGGGQSTGGAPDRSPIASAQLGRQFRGIAARFEAGRSLGGKTSEDKTAENTKKLVRESEKQREAIEKLAQALRQGGIQTLRTSLS